MSALPPSAQTAHLLGPSQAGQSRIAMGAETLDFIKRQTQAGIGQEACDAIVHEAIDVLSRTSITQQVNTPPSVGLVTGYVQSGKTLNFTALCALARDNEIPIVIVITGISKNLFKQSNDRLVQGLGIGGATGRQWRHVEVPEKGKLGDQEFGATISEWTDGRTPKHRRRGLLITVMKNHRRLDRLVKAFRQANFSQVPVLIIDDEGDQASLNYLANRDAESATYRHIGRLRARFPNHSYLQYTATPQAPLLINIIDALSPSSASVLTPGQGYTGGTTFFPLNGQRHDLVRRIPSDEVFKPDEVPSAPARSFLDAMACFFVGVAIGQIEDRGRGNRSMLVHPHQKVAPHGDYWTWARNVQAEWGRDLAQPTVSVDYCETVARLRAAYDDLLTTSQNLPSWDDVLVELPISIRDTKIVEVNSAQGGTPSIEWIKEYAHILVGGQAMDRGFTVEGLTVTYMPRGLGDGNADTIQQRARFFGYKQRYLGLCRVWLSAEVHDAFAKYVEHEESMREQLIHHGRTGQPLTEWRRRFFLDAALRPTRRQVLTVAYSRGNHGERWVFPRRPHETEDAIRHNNDLISRFAESLSFGDDGSDSNWPVAQRHHVAREVPVQRAFEDLLVGLKLPSPADSDEQTALLLEIEDWLAQHSDGVCTVFNMRPNAPTTFRTLSNYDDALEQPFQGANPGTGYKGDREIRTRAELTIQLHHFDLKYRNSTNHHSLVRIAAVHLPKAMGKDWLVQTQ